MKLSECADVAEILSGIAVVVTLIVLVIGVLDNSQVTRAATYAEIMEAGNQFERTILADPELRSVFSAFLGRQTESLPESDRLTLALIIAQMFRTYDTAYSMRSAEIFGDNEWSRFERRICDMYARAVAADQRNMAFGVVSDGFRQYLSETCAD